MEYEKQRQSHPHYRGKQRAMLGWSAGQTFAVFAVGV